MMCGAQSVFGLMVQTAKTICLLALEGVWRFTLCQKKRMELFSVFDHYEASSAERKNRTIMEAVKAIIHDQVLPMHLWAEAAGTVVYVQN